MGLSTDTDCSVHPPPGVIEKSYGLYPGFESFSSDYDAGDYREWIEQSNGDPLPAPLALYIQEFPGTGESQLRLAGTSAPGRMAVISGELELQGVLFDADRPLQQLLLSGSIATQWTDDQLYQLMAVVQDSFPMHHSGMLIGCVCAGAVVPDAGRLHLLHILGFDGIRVSLAGRAGMEGGLDEVGQSIGFARQSGFRQIVIDLPYSETLADVPPRLVETWLAEVKPDRIRHIGNPDDPDRSFVQILSALGYQNIGLDWYTLASDPLAQARASGLLHWSPLGFTDMPSPDVIGVGPGAISLVGEFYGRNESDWQLYQSMLSEGRLPIVCGIELESDDVMRREIMIMILTTSCIRTNAIEQKWGISFRQFFGGELEQLRALEQKNWLDWRQDRIRIHVRGYHELTEICRVFDRRARTQSGSSMMSCP